MTSTQLRARDATRRRPVSDRGERRRRRRRPQGHNASQALLYTAMTVMAAVGLLSPGEFNAAPAEVVLEAAFLISTVLAATKMDPTAIRIALLAAAYVAVKTALMLWMNPVGLLDFVQAYKAYIYMIGLAIFVRRRLFSGAVLAKVTLVLLGVFLLKYAYSIALGLHHRPGVYMENNYELVMLIGLFYLAEPYIKAWRNLSFVLLAATVLLSGSRSAAVCLLALYVFLYLRSSRRSWQLHLIGLIGVGAVVVMVFLDRMSGASIREIDRYVFFTAFGRDVIDWPLWQFLTGSFPLTALSPSSCNMLAYYSALFSQESPGTCYSVVLHSYLLRGVFDHGLLGLALLYGLVWVGLRRSGASVRDALALMSFFTASAASISAFNNVFVAIVLAVAFALDRELPATNDPEEDQRPRRAERRRRWSRPQKRGRRSIAAVEDGAAMTGSLPRRAAPVQRTPRRGRGARRRTTGLRPPV